MFVSNDYTWSSNAIQEHLYTPLSSTSEHSSHQVTQTIQTTYINHFQKTPQIITTMDGDQSKKTLDSGASAGKPFADFADDTLHEATKTKGEPVGEKTTGTGTSAFDASGAIGKQFTSKVIPDYTSNHHVLISYS